MPHRGQETVIRVLRPWRWRDIPRRTRPTRVYAYCAPRLANLSPFCGLHPALRCLRDEGDRTQRPCRAADPARCPHTSVRQLEADIRTFIDLHNTNPKPFKWTKSAGQILASIKRFCHPKSTAGIRKKWRKVDGPPLPAVSAAVSPPAINSPSPALSIFGLATERDLGRP